MSFLKDLAQFFLIIAIWFAIWAFLGLAVERETLRSGPSRHEETSGPSPAPQSYRARH